MEKNIAKEEKKIELPKNDFSWYKVIFLALLILFIYISTMIVTNYFTIKKYSSEKTIIAQELELTKEEITELELYIENATDPKFVEKIARENLKMVRPDEKVYIVMK